MYEAALRLGLTAYRKPWPEFNTEVWDKGFGVGEHDHYESVSDRPRYGAVASYLGVLPGKLSILDIGCGTGVMRERIADQKVEHYLGVDTAASAIERAQARNLPNSEFMVTGMPDGSFDAVLAVEMLYFVDDPESFLDDVRKLVRPGGLFIASITRFHGDFALRKMIARRFAFVDETIVLNPQHKRKWRVGCYKA